MFRAESRWVVIVPSVEQELVHRTPEALPLPGKPSIAVLAFTNMSGDLDQEYFSDGIADDIITELSRSHSLFVIARNSSFTYKGRAVDVKHIARELGVRYVVEGSVRRGGGRIRITAQLVDAETRNHIWAERYDRSLEDVFAVQDEITLAVATAIGPAVADAEMLRAMRRVPTSIGAWDLYQQGMWHLAKQDVAENDAARRLFERAIERDALFVAAHVGLSHL
jgi:adenylate cyclase